MPRRPALLLIEDSKDDAELFQRAVNASALPLDLRVVTNCSSARDYLLGTGEFADRAVFPFPRLIVADNCRESFGTADLLRWLRTKPECQVIPVIVMTGVGSPSLVRTSYDLGVHSVFEKPSSNADLQALLKLVVAYWSKALVPATVGNGVGR
jgi:two-component system response regulator